MLAALRPYNTKLDESYLSITGSGTFEFTLAPKTGRWAPGKYKVDLYIDDRFSRTLNFNVTGTIAARVPTAAPTKATCPAPTTPAIKSSGAIYKVVLSESTDSFHNPVNPTTVFKPTAKVHAVVFYKNMPANTKLKYQWFATDVGNMSSCNQKLYAGDITPSASGNLDLFIEKTDQWPVGSYRVEIYLNGKLDQVVNFSVKE